MAVDIAGNITARQADQAQPKDGLDMRVADAVTQLSTAAAAVLLRILERAAQRRSVLAIPRPHANRPVAS